MVEQFRLSNNKVTGSGDKEKECELIMNMMEDRVCQICKKPGHTAAQCRFNKNKKFKKVYKFKGTCNNCGRRGHKKADCWLLESNAHKRPQGWKHPNNNEIGGTSLEYILMTGDDQGGGENHNKVVYDTIPVAQQDQHGGSR